jgi:hypothetical protein
MARFFLKELLEDLMTHRQLMVRLLGDAEDMTGASIAANLLKAHLIVNDLGDHDAALA